MSDGYIDFFPKECVSKKIYNFMDDAINVREEDLEHFPGLGNLRNFTDESLADELIAGGELV